MDSYTIDSDDAVSVLRIEIPRIVADAVEAGKVSIGASYGQKGCNLWVQFLDPKVYHITYNVEDAAEELENSAGGGVGLLRPTTPPQSPEEKRMVELERQMEALRASIPTEDREEIRMSKSEADEIVRSRGLDKHRVNGVLNYYPTSSLAKQDFKRRSAHDLAARATVVASSMGPARAVSRIACDSTLRIPGCRDLDEWWKKASNTRRARLLTIAKTCDVNQVDVSAVRRIGNPFGNAGLGEQDSD
jgi:hypothetical protein